MPKKPVITAYKRFLQIPVEPKTLFPSALTPKSLLVSAKLPEKLEAAGSRMLAREMAELDEMNRIKEKFVRIMALHLSKGKTSLKDFNEKTQSLEERIQEKSKRIQSIMEKKNFF